MCKQALPWAFAQPKQAGLEPVLQSHPEIWTYKAWKDYTMKYFKEEGEKSSAYFALTIAIWEGQNTYGVNQT